MATNYRDLAHQRLQLVSPTAVQLGGVGAGAGGARSLLEGEEEEVVGEGKCCSMCGDYGLRSKLFRCKFQGCSRFQHTYCSNWYPEERAPNARMCNWCDATSCHNAGGTRNMQDQMRTTISSARVAEKGGEHNRTQLDRSDLMKKIAPIKSGGVCKSTNAVRGRRYKLVSEM